MKRTTSLPWATWILATLLLSPALFAQTGINGKWSFTAPTQQGPVEVAFNLKSDAKGVLSGSLAIPNSPMGEMAISDGKFAGNDVSFKVKLPIPQGAPAGFDKMVMNFTGKLNGDSLALTQTMEGMPEGMPAQPPQAIEAKRAKAAAPAPDKK